MQFVAIRTFGFERSQQSVHQPMRLSGMVASEVANVDIQSYSLQLWLGVDAQV